MGAAQVLITNGQGRGRKDLLLPRRRGKILISCSSAAVAPKLSEGRHFNYQEGRGKIHLTRKKKKKKKKREYVLNLLFFGKFSADSRFPPTVVTPTFFTIRFLFLRRSTLNTMQPRDLKFGFLFFLPPACTFLFSLRVRPRGPAIPINFFPF